MVALILLVIFGGGGILVAINIIRGHAENLENPELRNFMIAFWLFIILGVWNMYIRGNPDGTYTWTFIIYAIIAVPCIILNIIQGFMND